jgi:hypothetical protein
MANYVAVIGDMVGSRKLVDFREARSAMDAVLQQINLQHRDQVASGFLITLGDEFQGLLHTPAPVPAILAAVYDALAPLGFRFGVGVGPITSGPLAPLALGMYGPCFTQARDALMRAKRQGLPLAWGSGKEPIEQVLEAQILLLSTLRGRWTTNMRDTVRLRRAAKRQLDVAEQMGKSPSVVSETLKAAGWPAIRRGEASLQALMALLDAGRSS